MSRLPASMRARFGRWSATVPRTGGAASRCYQAGAKYGNPEFIQVHPTAIPGEDKCRLISESARGEGGRVWVPRKAGDTRAPSSIPENERDQWIRQWQDPERSVSDRLRQVDQLYRDAGVHESAQRLVDKYEERCLQFVEGVEPEALRDLLRYLVDVVLERPADVQPTIPFSEPTSITKIHSRSLESRTT